MDMIKRVRSVCTHTGRSVVHPVDGGYRVHCLKCGTVGPLRESRDAARLSLSGAGRLRGGGGVPR